MDYYCITHVPIPWKLPGFLKPIAVEAVDDERVEDISGLAPQLRARNATLSDFAALFTLRRRLQGGVVLDSDGVPMIGVGQYRRFAVASPLFGEPQDVNNLVLPEVFNREGRRALIPPPETLVFGHPVTFNVSVLEHYATFHVAQDLLRFISVAIDLGVVSGRRAATFLSQKQMIIVPSVGVFPREWFISALEALEAVTEHYERHFSVERDGYQARATAFCLERLMSLMLEDLIGIWPPEQMRAHPMMLLAADRL